MSEKNEQLDNIYSSINNILKNVNAETVTSESNDEFSSLPDGYFLSEVVRAELTESKSSGNPMVKWQFKTVENGIGLDGNGNRIEIKGTTKKTAFLYHVLKDSSTVERFISDALKFEGEESGVPFLDKEYFTTAETLDDALELLTGLQLWLHVDTDDSSNTWTRMVSWKRAERLGLE